MAVLNVLYQDMQEEVLEQAKKVSVSGCLLLNNRFCGQLILDVFEVHKEERVIANKIRQEFDKQHGKLVAPARIVTEKLTKSLACALVGESWNCVVGKNFGSHVIHQTEGYLFCNYRDEISILLWKSS